MGGDSFVSKYNARKTEVDGYMFDSGQEALRYGELKLLQDAGKIHGLAVHPIYVLCDAFTDAAGVKYRRAVYEGDFGYFDVEAHRLVCEDVKGFVTPTGKLKLKLAANAYRRTEFRVIKV